MKKFPQKLLFLLIAPILVFALFSGGRFMLAAVGGLFGSGTINTSADLTRGLVGHWTFDEMAGTSAADSSGNGNTGTLTNMATSTNGGWTAGAMSTLGLSGGGGALDFDGVDDFVNADGGIDLDNTFTITGWLNADDLNNNLPLVARADFVRFEINSNQLWFRVWDTTFRTVTSNTISTGTWYYFAGIYNHGSSIELYLDGVSQGTTGIGNVGGSGTQLSFGARGYVPDRFFNGKLDDVRIYNRALSADEIRRLYNNNGPVAHWKFDEGAGRYAYDSSQWSGDVVNDLIGYWSMNDNVSGNGATITDASGNGNNGTTDDGANNTGMDCTVSGQSDKGCDFDGTDDRVTLPSLTVGSNATLLAWAKVDVGTNCSTNLNPIMASGSSGQNGIFFFDSDCDDIAFKGSSGANVQGVQILDYEDNSFDPYSWNFYAGVSSSEGMFLYINGILVASNTTDFTNIGISGTMAIGNANGDATRYFNGLIDEVYIFNRAFTENEIRYLYNLQNNDGTLGNATCQPGSGTCPTWSATGGKYGGALDFDGTDDYVRVDNSSTTEPGTGDFTVEAWINPDTITSQDYIFHKGPTNTINCTSGNRHWRLGIRGDASDLLEYVACDSSTGNSLQARSSAISTGVWTHVVAVHTLTANPDTVTFYINGEIAETSYLLQSNLTTAIYSSADLYMGSVVGTDTFFDGTLDDVRIYNYARTSEQILVDYNAGLAAKFGGTPDLTRGLVGHWQFDELAGTSALDASGNGNTGTLTNGPTWTTGATSTLGLSGGGGALDFDGVDDRVDMGDVLDMTELNGISLHAWVKFKSHKNFNAIIDKLSSNGNYRLVGTATQKVEFTIRDTGGGGETLNSNTSLNLNQWYHVVATFDDVATGKIYIDGVLDATKTDFTLTRGNTTTALKIGRTDNNIVNFDGSIDDVRIYNRVLSAEEIRYLYNNNGPIAHWKFDEGSGATALDSIGSNDGTLNGSMTDSDWVVGKYGTALDFDGVDDFVNVNDNSVLSTNDKTISAWIKTTDSAGRIVAKGASSQWEYALEVSGGKAIFTTWQSGGATHAFVNSNTTVNDGSWQHIVGTQIENDTIAIYVNGILQNTDSTFAGSQGDGTQSLLIGKRSDGGFLDGVIDDVKIYNYARTSEQILVDYNAGLAAKFGGTPDLRRGLVGHWQFDELVGTSAIDASGNGNTGTLTNMAASTNGGWTTGATSTLGLSGGGGGLDFDGVDDRVDMGDVLDLIGSPLTLSAWVKVNKHKDFSGIIDKLQSGGNYRLLINADAAIHFGIRDTGNSFEEVISNTTLNTNQWYHIVATFDDVTTGKIYVDGVLDITKTDFTLTRGNTGTTLKIGRSSNNNINFNGTIDDVRIYNRALTAEEIRYLYNNNGPIAHWKFDEGSGTTAFDSVGNIDGTLNGEMATSTVNGWKKGKYGNALDFDGTDDYVDMGDPTDLDITGDITITAWINPDTISGSVEIVNKKFDTGASGYRLRRIGSNLHFEWSDGITTQIGVTAANTLSANTWQHVAVSYDLNNVRLYVDGVNARIVAHTETIATNTTSLKIGGYAGLSAYWFDGKIDDVRIYNYARTPAQIQADYNAGKSIYFR